MREEKMFKIQFRASGLKSCWEVILRLLQYIVVQTVLRLKTPKKNVWQIWLGEHAHSWSIKRNKDILETVEPETVCLHSNIKLNMGGRKIFFLEMM